MGSGQQLSFGCFTKPHQRHKPEQTVMYKAVAANFRTFEALAESGGKRLPKHVSEEFDEYLKCGILAHGFLRLRCNDCKKEKLVAFSCKKRGFCSSCGGRRMAETAAHLVDAVIPKAGVRQWVLSFPMPIRYILARQPKHLSKVLTIVHRAIATFIKQKARQKGFRGNLEPGAVTLVQRFGGSINLNVHLHMLFLEGGFYRTNDGARLWWIDSPTDEEIKEMVKLLSYRIIRYLKKHDYFRDEIEDSGPEFEQEELIPELLAASIRSKIALGQRRGQYVRRLGQVDFTQTFAELSGPLCAQIAGFSLHAAVYCKPWERNKLEKLIRYVARPAVAEQRLRQLPSGEIVYKLKNKYSDGTSHLMFSGVEFVEKLASLVPPPRIHLTRYFGCLGPHSKIRSLVVPKPDEPKDEGAEPNQEPKKKAKNYSWAKLLARTFNIDVEHCEYCGGDLKIIAAILETQAVTKILIHLGESHKPPDIAPPAFPSQMTFE